MLGRHDFWRAALTLGASAVKLAIVLSMLPGSLAGTVYVYKLLDFPPGIGIAFRADSLGMFFALVSSTLWIVTTLYAIGYMKGKHALVRFFGFFALCVSTTVGIAFAENLLTLFLFYEILTLSTYPLVSHKGDEKTVRSARVYLGILLATSIGLFLLGHECFVQVGR